MNYFYAYMRMALGLPWNYVTTLEACTQECQSILDGGRSYVDYVWTDDALVDEICKAKGITRERFIRSMAAPKPSPIAHLIFNDELKRFYGETLPAWPRRRGLIIPRWENKRIAEIRFYPLRELLKPRLRITNQ